ncbi:MAG: Gfo/Idh/MocA family protein [Candidatus Sumerlaeaceae bacterium]
MKVGFIDYNLNNYHSTKFHGLLKLDGIDVVAAYESSPKGGDWCEAKGVKRVDSVAEVVALSEGIIVLAPNAPEHHLELSREPLASGKPVLVDKVLASSLSAAKQMVELASKSGTPLMSASSLRFSVELEEMLARAGDTKLDGIFSRGGGKWRGYAVHTVAPVLRMLGVAIKRVIDTGKDAAHMITVEAEDGRRASIDLRKAKNQMEVLPWQVGYLNGDEYDVVTIKLFDEFYANLMKQALEFFRTGKSPIATQEMLDTVAVEEAADQSIAKAGQWVELSSL